MKHALLTSFGSGMIETLQPLDRPRKAMVSLACVMLFACGSRAAPLFHEDFNAEITVKGRHLQAQSNLPIKHGYDAMPG